MQNLDFLADFTGTEWWSLRRVADPYPFYADMNPGLKMLAVLN
jgi:hypothetical protein